MKNRSRLYGIGCDRNEVTLETLAPPGDPAGEREKVMDTSDCRKAGNFTSSLSLVSNMSIDVEPMKCDESIPEKTSRPKRMLHSLASPFTYLRRSCLKPQISEDSEISLYTPKHMIDSPRVSTFIVLGIDGLLNETKFTREELQRMYRGFKTECPSGLIDMETFLYIHSMLFPGSDPSLYGNRLFSSFDIQKSGKLSFEGFVLALSRCLHGTCEDKLRWAFSLYDLNDDGFIEKKEIESILLSIFGLTKHDKAETASIPEHVENLFTSMDLNNDGLITEHEFVACCLKNETLLKSLCEGDECVREEIEDYERNVSTSEYTDE